MDAIRQETRQNIKEDLKTIHNLLMPMDLPISYPRLRTAMSQMLTSNWERKERY